MNIYEKPHGVKTRWVSFENATGKRGAAALANKGAKGYPSDRLIAGEQKHCLT